MHRFIYTNELSFADDANVRLLMDHLHIDKGEITKMLSGAPAYLGSTEWEHRRLPLDGDSPEGSVSELEFDTRTVKSVSSAGTSVSRRVSTTMSLSPPPPDLKAKPGVAVRARSVSSATSAISKTSPLSTTSSPSKAPPRASVNTSSSTTPTRSRIAAGGASALKLPANPSSVTRQTSSTASSTVASQTSPNALGRSHYPLPRLYSTPDPHHHPATAPPPASALSVYMLSHRYRLETLESLAKEHILTHMTSDNCIPML